MRTFRVFSGIGSWVMGLLFAAAVLGLSGCASRPTTANENPERRMEPVEQAGPLQVTPETTVLDARPAFEYSTGHIPSSISIQWSDFTEPQPAQRGILQGDTFAIARRLARLGITPDTKVVVVGRGLQGHGEEGRVAWMLAYLGVRNVRFADLEAFKGNLTTLPSEPPKNAPIWKPEVDESLNVSRQELLHVINHSGVHKPIAYPEGAAPVLYRIIDVRPTKEYLGKEGLGKSRPVPNMDAINIPWKEFFTPLMRPSQDLALQLQNVGVLPEHRVIVLGEEGVASAAATMALRALGYSKAGNYAGGLQDLMSAYAPAKP